MFLQWESDLEKYKEQEAKLTVSIVYYMQCNILSAFSFQNQVLYYSFMIR